MTRRLPASAVTWLLLPLAVLRLTRLITSDHLGEWLLVGRLRTWADRAEFDAQHRAWEAIIGAKPPFEDWLHKPAGGTWQSRLVQGFDCPFCIPFWLGGAFVVASYLMPKRLRTAWNLGLASLGLNYVTGHISKRID
jgi:hypothetical protein